MFFFFVFFLNSCYRMQSSMNILESFFFFSYHFRMTWSWLNNVITFISMWTFLFFSQPILFATVGHHSCQGVFSGSMFCSVCVCICQWKVRVGERQNKTKKATEISSVICLLSPSFVPALLFLLLCYSFYGLINTILVSPFPSQS